ncbi:MAG TPA: FAD binding domain-containing protein [Rectinemataceae bacterium]|nr:FAD binding domain-containing protein [Rectinemataceae bacterium]
MVASEIHYPATIAELIDLHRENPSLLLYAGGTEILRERGGRFVDLPPVIALLDGIAELRTIHRTEGFVDLGAGLKISELLAIRKGTLPDPFVRSLRGIATPAIRNLATLGGNLATRRRFMDTWSILACLDATVELRDSAGPRWVNVNRLADEEGKPALPVGTLLTKVRLPLEAWTHSIARKVGNPAWPSDESATFSAIARIEKNIVISLRMAWAGTTAFRFPELEGRVVGLRLPIDPLDRSDIVEAFAERAAELDPTAASRLARIVDATLELLGR